jgi:hypothetical protein
MRKKPDRRTIEDMILDSQPTMRIGADRNIRSAVQQTYRELGVSADNLSMTGSKASPKQLVTGEKQIVRGARKGQGWIRFAGVTAALAAIVGIVVLTVAIKNGKLGGNHGGVTPAKNPVSNVPVYLLTEIGYPSYSDKEKLIYPKRGQKDDELIMDWPGETIVDTSCDYYSYDVMDEYCKMLAENGYEIIQGDPADIAAYRESHYKEDPNGYTLIGFTLRKTNGVFEGKKEWAAYKDGVLIVIEIPWSAARVYTYVSRETPFGGCTAKEAKEIVMNPETRVDLFPLGSQDSCTPNIDIDPIDVTPSGLYEKTQAQVFLTLLEHEGILYRRFFIIRDGIAYEWEDGNVAFGDIDGDGMTEICMVQRERIIDGEYRLIVKEKFWVFKRPEEDGVPWIVTMTLDESAFPGVKWDNSWSGYVSYNYCSLDYEGNYVIVIARDSRRYKLFLSGALYLSDCETGKRVSQSGK